MLLQSWKWVSVGIAPLLKALWGLAGWQGCSQLTQEGAWGNPTRSPFGVPGRKKKKLCFMPLAVAVSKERAPAVPWTRDLGTTSGTNPQCPPGLPEKKSKVPAWALGCVPLGHVPRQLLPSTTPCFGDRSSQPGSGTWAEASKTDATCEFPDASRSSSNNKLTPCLAEG